MTVAAASNEHNYRAFFLTRDGRISHAEGVSALDDAEAVTKAQAILQDAVTCEVWQATRLVAKFDGRNGGILQPR